jgi:hypothetical protein
VEFDTGIMVANPHSFSAHPDSEAKKEAVKHKFLHGFKKKSELLRYLASVLLVGKNGFQVLRMLS